jgi:drug/metabolite transporter (DMT)-like permease
MHNKSRGMLALYSSILLLSFIGLFAKKITLDATSLTQVRSLIAAVGFIILCSLQGRVMRLSNLKEYFGVYGVGVLLGIHWVTFFYSMKVSTVAIGTLSLFSYPVISILIEPFFSKQKLKFKDVGAGIMVLVGLGVMVSQDLTDLKGSVVQGVSWGLFSASIFAFRNMFQKYHFHGVASYKLILHQVSAVALMLLFFVDYPSVLTMPALEWGKLFCLGIVITAGGHTLLSYSLKLLPAKSVALIGCVQPPLASFIAWIFIGEVPETSVILGGGIILCVAMFESAPKKLFSLSYISK